MNKVFILRHVAREGNDEDWKKIGVYTSEALAEQAIERVKDKPGFKEPGGRFTIDPILVNFDYWADGFGPPDLDDATSGP